ncbi:hypothetical protein MKW92_044112 [Papaver armeniacum]|nr:hypothetical protein MKW92_044112 [Papaver armeniacum]
MGKVLKTDGNEGRFVGKSMVVKLLREKDSLLSDVNSDETCNKIILSSCRSCLDSLQKLFMEAARVGYYAGYYNEFEDKQVSLEVDNLLWFLDILVDRQAAEEFALMWANQRELANLHTKLWMPSRRLVSCITTRLFVGIGNGEILLANDTRQLLLLTWFQPLVDDYTCLQRLPSFDRIVVEQNNERIILELTLEDQQRILLAWFGYVLNGDICPNLQKDIEGWCTRTFTLSVKKPSISLN